MTYDPNELNKEIAYKDNGNWESAFVFKNGEEIEPVEFEQKLS